MSVSTPRSKSVPSAEPTIHNDAIPPLKDGDRLTRDEFMRRYEAMPELKKAELVEGVVHVPSDVLQNGLDSLEHAEFVARLRDTAANNR